MSGFYRRAPLFVIALLVLACAGIWVLAFAPHVQNVADLEPSWVAQVLEVEISATSRVAAIVEAQPLQLHLPPRTKTSGCRVQGPLPDPECSPGAVFAN